MWSTPRLRLSLLVLYVANLALLQADGAQFGLLELQQEVQCRTGRELALAFANPNIREAVLLEDIILAESDFAGLNSSQAIIVQRNLTIRGLEASWPLVLDMNYLRAKHAQRESENKYAPRKLCLALRWPLSFPSSWLRRSGSKKQQKRKTGTSHSPPNVLTRRDPRKNSPLTLYNHAQHQASSNSGTLTKYLFHYFSQYEGGGMSERTGTATGTATGKLVALVEASQETSILLLLLLLCSCCCCCCCCCCAFFCVFETRSVARGWTCGCCCCCYCCPQEQEQQAWTTQPGFDILSVEPDAGGRVAIIEIKDCYILYKLCFPESVARTAFNVSRPAEVPGKMAYILPYPSPYTCTNYSPPAAPAVAPLGSEGAIPPLNGGDSKGPLSRYGCFKHVILYVDIAVYGGDMNDDLTPSYGFKYPVHALNTQALCLDILSDACIEKYGYIGCLTYTTNSHVAQSPPIRQLKSPGPATLAGSSAAAAAGRAPQESRHRLAALLGSIIGGAGLLTLTAAVAVFVVRLRRRRRKYGIPKAVYPPSSPSVYASGLERSPAESASGRPKRESLSVDDLGSKFPEGAYPYLGLGLCAARAAAAAGGPHAAAAANVQQRKQHPKHVVAAAAAAAPPSSPSAAAANPVLVTDVENGDADGELAATALPRRYVGGDGSQRSLCLGSISSLGHVAEDAALLPVTPLTPLHPGINLNVRLGDGADELQLSSVTLGKGAFGRVVAGVYGGVRVAVKIIDHGLLGQWRPVAVAAAAVAVHQAGHNGGGSPGDGSCGSPGDGGGGSPGDGGGGSPGDGGGGSPGDGGRGSPGDGGGGSPGDGGGGSPGDGGRGSPGDGGGGRVVASLDQDLQVGSGAVAAAATAAAAMGAVKTSVGVDRLGYDASDVDAGGRDCSTAASPMPSAATAPHEASAAALPHGSGQSPSSPVTATANDGAVGVVDVQQCIPAVMAAAVRSPAEVAEASVLVASCSLLQLAPNLELALKQEVEILARCQHPNVVRLLAACLSPPTYCLVMERMETSLDRMLYDSVSRKPKLLPLDAVLTIAIQIAKGLTYLHPTIVHRDLKPGNVLISRSDPNTGRLTVKIADFGLSRLRDTVLITRNPEVGTAQYIAPEAFDVCNNRITDRVDVYALGIIIWEMLAGVRPWAGLHIVVIALSVAIYRKRPPLEAVPRDRCPPKLRLLIESCWEQIPERRPAAAEVAKRLVLIQQQCAELSIIDHRIDTRGRKKVKPVSQRGIAECMTGPYIAKHAKGNDLNAEQTPKQQDKPEMFPDKGVWDGGAVVGNASAMVLLPAATDDTGAITPAFHGGCDQHKRKLSPNQLDNNECGEAPNPSARSAKRAQTQCQNYLCMCMKSAHMNENAPTQCVPLGL
ncbi:hypothetical protein VOLCADRAFT_98918 [Volvox carteri f. nagariensis]|uniref:Protein kinase domain-containing protein n=1 Tax=Volvox carteri f. nagariensis TaxID=3068 RepID=D8UGL6_VOLCA|nr:uncharacterized protein VOLCADRAFT_98918 [Volvox carteri f. nagariensis]EFJ41120.1 hypothetical protein VOLCADRAFT_98918 [Volvox carteri f. nagariensis]|eukprot:XP_002957792.1 hypothetical protein VOLCADRAFT_98918 [Volvox carteri f. nagariensis]